MIWIWSSLTYTQTPRCSHAHTHIHTHSHTHKFTQTKNAQLTWIGSLQRRISKQLINLRCCSMLLFIGGQGGGCTWNHSAIPHTHWSDSIKRWACQVWGRWQDCRKASRPWSAQRIQDSEEAWSTDVSNTWTMYSDNPSPTGNRTPQQSGTCNSLPETFFVLSYGYKSFFVRKAHSTICLPSMWWIIPTPLLPHSFP